MAAAVSSRSFGTIKRGTLWYTNHDTPFETVVARPAFRMADGDGRQQAEHHDHRGQL